MAAGDWKQIDDDTLLNYEGAHTGEMARFERIMQHRTTEAMRDLSERLKGLMETIYRAGQLMQEKAEAVISRLDAAMSKADEAVANAKQAARAQRKQQLAMIGLTVALVLCTLLYTGINAWVAMEMRAGNRLQAEAVAAAEEQARAARDANDLARRAQERPPAGQTK